MTTVAKPKVASYRNVGPKSVPQDIRNLRQKSLEFHSKYGQPVIHKHRWNELDVQKGIARHCPYDHDDIYGQGRQWDPYCFGTGFLGGWDDGTITFLTLADAPTERLRIGPGGTLVYQREPTFTAPWIPDLGDGDIIITGIFSPNTWDILELRDRYILHEINPVTMRGFESKVRPQGIEYLVNQSGQVEKLPLGHQYYDVPVIFDYNDLPPVPINPPGTDPDDYPTNTFSVSERGLFIIGGEGVSTQDERAIRLTPRGTQVFNTRAIRITGKDLEPIVIFS